MRVRAGVVVIASAWTVSWGCAAKDPHAVGDKKLCELIFRARERGVATFVGSQHRIERPTQSEVDAASAGTSPEHLAQVRRWAAGAPTPEDITKRCDAFGINLSS